MAVSSARSGIENRSAKLANIENIERSPGEAMGLLQAEVSGHIIAMDPAVASIPAQSQEP